jgi:hypothetical protein
MLVVGRVNANVCSIRTAVRMSARSTEEPSDRGPARQLSFSRRARRRCGDCSVNLVEAQEASIEEGLQRSGQARRNGVRIRWSFLAAWRLLPEQSALHWPVNLA